MIKLLQCTRPCTKEAPSVLGVESLAKESFDALCLCISCFYGFLYAPMFTRTAKLAISTQRQKANEVL